MIRRNGLLIKHHALESRHNKHCYNIANSTTDAKSNKMLSITTGMPPSPHHGVGDLARPQRNEGAEGEAGVGLVGNHLAQSGEEGCGPCA